MKKKAGDFLTKAVATFFGSWHSIVLHTVIFGIWLVGHFDINALTMWVSLEAIYFGIFILMAENREQAQRDKREHREKAHELQLVNHDVETNDHALREIMMLKHEIRELKEVIHVLLEKK